MTGKIIKFGESAQEDVIKGVELAADAISTTLGPAGRCVCISGDFGAPEITRDGATVAKSIQFSDPMLNNGALLLRKASSLTEELVGDGTSTVSILVKELCKKGQRHLKTGANVNEIWSGMLKAQKWMTGFIQKNAVKVDGDLELIRRVATVSANNDPEIGNYVVDCMSKVGINGVITADFASGLETVIDVTKGMKLDRGWSSPHYINEVNEGQCVMENPGILVVSERISSVAQLRNFLEDFQTHSAGRPLLIICDDIDENTNTMLVYNTLQGAIRCCVVKGIDFGDSRKNIMSDIAIATGADFICPDNGIDITQATIESLGSAKKVVISKDNTIIYEGEGDPAKINAVANILKKRISDPTTSLYDKSKFEKRLAGLVGGISIIKAGGATEAEKLNRKATIVDAILASKSAIDEGCAPGGGYIYCKGAIESKKDKSFWKDLVGDEKEGAEIVFSSLPIIMRTVAENSGVSGDVVLNVVENNIKKSNYGYNAKTKTYCDLYKEGILDSAKVLRVALEQSVSTASQILLSNCFIYDEEDDNKVNDMLK